MTKHLHRHRRHPHPHPHPHHRHHHYHLFIHVLMTTIDLMPTTHLPEIGAENR